MKKIVTLLLLSCVLFSSACGRETVTPSPTVEGAEEPSPPTDTPEPTTPTPTEAVPTVTPTPLPPPPPRAPGPAYELESEIVVAGYAVRLWKDTTDELGFNKIVVIATAGQPKVQVEMATGFHERMASDVTGEGNPDAVIEVFTGGAHCCFSTVVYDLGPVLTKVLETPLSNCSSRFEQLDDDPALEVITCDDLFAYYYCAYAGSPLVQVVLDYVPGSGYVPASPDFPDAYAEQLASAEEWATMDIPGWDETNKCAVLFPVLTYLYLDRPTDAWAAMQRYYDEPDISLFWHEVTGMVQESSLYTAATPLPDVPHPDYYALHLLTACDPDWRRVGFVSEAGVDPCVTDVPWRDYWWLNSQLRELDLLAEGEDLVLTPEGCTTNCRLDVVRRETDERTGSIRLDTAYPGAVYRVNGEESARWRLRGDLTWERIEP